jgi:hypothetical protein
MENNAELVKTFLDNLDIGATTKKDYTVKLNKLSKEIKLDDTEDNLKSWFSQIENPNTRSNKIFVVIRLRRHFKMPTSLLEDMRGDLKKEIVIHRKQKAKDNIESLVSYEQLLKELDTKTGRDYYMNYLYAKHGVRNKDINVKIVHKTPKQDPTENTMVFNPKLKKPLIKMYIVDYKTADTYGDKYFEIKDQRLYDEIKSLSLKNNDYMFATRDGQKATINYMNVLATKNSLFKYGEGRIAKILLKNLIDSQQYDKIERLSHQRGTSLQTLYTSYNIMDNK